MRDNKLPALSITSEDDTLLSCSTHELTGRVLSITHSLNMNCDYKYKELMKHQLFYRKSIGQINT